MLSIRAFLPIVITASMGFSANKVDAGTIDWSSLTLSGTFPTFTFSEATLGTVTLSYSTDSERFGISSQFAEDTLIVGNTGGESLTMFWDNSISDLYLEIWDIDALSGTIGESLSISSSATITPTLLHPTDTWNSTSNILGNDGTPNDNSTSGNFSILHFADAAGFSSITFDWSVSKGTGSFGIGIVSTDPIPAHIPIPASLPLLAFGLGGLGLIARRKRKAA